MDSTAIIMTCHNRRNHTIKCLKSVFNQGHITNRHIKVFLVDDGSTDNTADAVRELFPDVCLIEGDGTLYWSGGMRKAWQKALEIGFDIYIWLNDDVELFNNALSDLFETHELMSRRWGDQVIISGSMIDPVTHNRSYGGALLERGKEVPIEPGTQPKEVHIIAGNCVLIPKAVVGKIGNLERRFTHGMGDYDYALRARKNGVRIFIASNYQGYCIANLGVSWWDPSISLAKRWSILHGPKGPPPWEYLLFAWRHKRALMPFSLAKIYLRVLFPRLFS